MMASEPMSDERLAEIRAQLANWPRGYWLAGVKSASLIQNTSEMRDRHEIAVISAEHTATIDLLTHAYTDMLALLAEVERLRAREAALVALVALAQTFANMPDNPSEPFDFYAPLKAEARRLLTELGEDTMLQAARALLAATEPTDATTAE